MENTRENVIKLLEVMESEAIKAKVYFRLEGDELEVHERSGLNKGLFIARRLLESEEAFKNFYDCYKKNGMIGDQDND